MVGTSRGTALVAACLWVLPGVAGASPPEAPPSPEIEGPRLPDVDGPEAPPTVVLPTVVLMVPWLADDDRDERTEATIRAHLQDVGLRLITRRYDPAELDLRELFARSAEPVEAVDARGILWIDLQASDYSLYVIARDGSQIHGRRIDAADLGDAVALEVLANVAGMAAVALAEGRAIRLAPDPETAEPETEPEPEPEPDPGPLELHVEGTVVPVPGPRLRARVGYRGQTYATGAMWVSAAELALAWRPAPGAHLELSYDAHPRVVVDDPTFGLRLELLRVPFGLAGGYRFDVSDAWGVEVAARLGVEPTRRSTLATDPDLAATDPSWAIAATAGADLRVLRSVAPGVRLWLGLGLHAALVRSEYGLRDMEFPLVTQVPLRVSASGGVEFEFLSGRP